MTKTKRTTYLLLIILFVVSFLVFIYPGMPESPASAATRLLLLVAVFGLTWSTLLGRYQVSLPRFIGKSDTQIDLEYAMPKSIRAHYDDFIENNLELISQRQEVDNVYYYLYESSRQIFLLQNCIHTPDHDIRNEVNLSNKFLGMPFEEGYSRIFEIDPGDENELQEIYVKGSMPKSIVLTPVRYEDQIVGVLAADSSSYNAFKNDFIPFLEANSSIISAGLQYLEAIYQLDKKSSFLKKLANFNTLMSVVETPEALYENLAAVSREFFSYDKLTIAILPRNNPVEGKFIFVDGYAEDFETDSTFQLGEGIWSYIIVNREKILSNNYEKHLPIDHRFRPHDLEGKLFESVLGVPLIVGNQVVGALTIETFKSLNFTKKELEVLMLIGLNFASAFHRLDMYSSMKRIETVDALTGTLNHRAFMERFFEEVYRAKRYEYEVSYLQVDIDHFKHMQDMHGHLFADYVISAAAGMVRESIRRVDILARTDQSTFAVILIKCGRESAEGTALRIRERLEESDFSFQSIHERLKVRVLCSCYPTDAAECTGLIENAQPVPEGKSNMQRKELEV